MLSASTGSISGSVAFSYTASTALRMTTADAGVITFNNGATFSAGTFFTGNAFSAISLNSILFASSSPYIAQEGSNPLGASQQASLFFSQEAFIR